MNKTINQNELVDINDICVDKSLPKKERIAEYVRQIKDPYHFKCGNFTVSVSYADNAISLEDCIAGIML